MTTCTKKVSSAKGAKTLEEDPTDHRVKSFNSMITAVAVPCDDSEEVEVVLHGRPGFLMWYFMHKESTPNALLTYVELNGIPIWECRGGCTLDFVPDLFRDRLDSLPWGPDENLLVRGLLPGKTGRLVISAYGVQASVRSLDPPKPTLLTKCVSTDDGQLEVEIPIQEGSFAPRHLFCKSLEGDARITHIEFGSRLVLDAPSGIAVEHLEEAGVCSGALIARILDSGESIRVCGHLLQPRGRLLVAVHGWTPSGY